MNIKWPWAKNRKRFEALFEALQEEITCLKQALMAARVANFIMIQEYVGDPLCYEMKDPISLPDLLHRIEKLEGDKI